MTTLGVIIGRFNPVHSEHIRALIAPAVEKYDKVLILLGSSESARDSQNPIPWHVRMELIDAGLEDYFGKEYFNKHMYPNITYAPLKDYDYSKIQDARWQFEVQKLVAEVPRNHFCIKDYEVTILGSTKDDSTYYVKNFPQWNHEYIQNATELSATAVRKLWYERNWEELQMLVFPSVLALLKQMREYEQYEEMAKQYHWLNNYKMVLAKRERTVQALVDDGTGAFDEMESIDIYKPMPYDPIYYTTDNVIIWRGHVLLIQRGAHPGKGLWALPGGFLNPNETISNGALRELEEETRIRIYEPNSKRRTVLSPAWQSDKQVFDAPKRSLRGRIITTAHLIQIPDEFEVDTRAGDDAAKARFFPLYDVLATMGTELFEDHQQIIAAMVF